MHGACCKHKALHFLKGKSQIPLRQLVRSWLRTSQCNGIWHEPASNMFGASSELASVMEFGFYRTRTVCSRFVSGTQVPYRRPFAYGAMTIGTVTLSWVGCHVWYIDEGHEQVRTAQYCGTKQTIHQEKMCLSRINSGKMRPRVTQYNILTCPTSRHTEMEKKKIL